MVGFDRNTEMKGFLYLSGHHELHLVADDFPEGRGDAGEFHTMTVAGQELRG